MNTEPDRFRFRPSPPPAAVHVAVAVLCDSAGAVLVTRRHDHAHQGGLWEFPGGKVEIGEQALAALRRELEEELGITALAARPLITVPHDYHDRQVWLDVWRIEQWRGTPAGREGQPLAWISPMELDAMEFPPADVPIINATCLPPLYMITPDPGNDETRFIGRIQECLVAGVSLLQLRAKSLPADRYAALARQVIGLARVHRCKVLLNSEPEAALTLGADGVHLTRERLRRCKRRPLPPTLLVATSCHQQQDLEHAHRIEADFAVLGPVERTLSHPRLSPMGWDRFAQLAAHARCPIYALGGMSTADVDTAWYAGGQGIAVIRSIWEARDCRTAVADALAVRGAALTAIGDSCTH
ncbi:MAG: Nudix family hydrolase [Chromatiales bacterium]